MFRVYDFQPVVAAVDGLPKGLPGAMLKRSRKVWNSVAGQGGS
jgi:hypothetical protein